MVSRRLWACRPARPRRDPLERHRLDRAGPALGGPAILVGVPWSFLLVSLDVADSVSLNVLFVALAMLINGTLIFLLCRLITRWRSE
jgi:hypothetical protein